MNYHLPSHHPEFGREKGKAISPEMKALLTTARSVVNSILDGEESVTLKHTTLSKKKEIIKLPHIENNSDTRKVIKNTVHNAIKIVGIDTKRRIKTAIDTLGKQYANMTPGRFFHRLENGKVDRDFRFLIAILQYIGKIGPEGMREALDSITSSSHYMGLEESPAIKALSKMLSCAKIAFKKQYEIKKEKKIAYDAFLASLYEKI